MNQEESIGARLLKERPFKGSAALAGITAAALLAAAVPLCSAGREPFVTWFYPICWYAIIVLLDAILVLAGARSFILGGGFSAGGDGGVEADVATDHEGGVIPSPGVERPRTAAFFFPALLFWSAAVWFFFEALNFRLADWYYVYIPDSPWVRVLSSFLSFATVLPALFLVERVFERAGLFRGLTCRRLSLGPTGRRVLVAAGLLCLVLPMARPRLFFPLVWLSLAFLFAPLNEKRLESSLLSDLAEGRPGRLLRILAAGLVCGVIWEFLNSYARIRWIYTVPFMENVKIFEMPPLGFFGFPPFAVECAAVYGVLVGFGLAPGTGRIRRRAGARPLGPAALAAAALLAAAGMGFAYEGMVRYNTASFTPRLGPLELPGPVRELAASAGIDNAFDLQKALDDPVVSSVLARDGVDVRAAADLLGLALHRGIGSPCARALERLGIRGVAGLAGRDPEKLARRLKEEVEKGGPPVAPARAGGRAAAAKAAPPARAGGRTAAAKAAPPARAGGRTATTASASSPRPRHRVDIRPPPSHYSPDRITPARVRIWIHGAGRSWEKPGSRDG